MKVSPGRRRRRGGCARDEASVGADEERDDGSDLVRLTQRPIAVRSVMVAATGVPVAGLRSVSTAPPAVGIESTTEFAASGEEFKVSMTSAPSAARRRAMGAPMPRLAPVPSATRPRAAWSCYDAERTAFLATAAKVRRALDAAVLLDQLP